MAQMVGGSADCHTIFTKRDISCSPQQEAEHTLIQVYKHETHLTCTGAIHLLLLSGEVAKNCK